MIKPGVGCRNLLAATFVLVASSAFAGKEPKYSEFRNTYNSVMADLKDPGKKAKARAILESVKSAMSTMDRLAFYSFVSKKESELMALR